MRRLIAQQRFRGKWATGQTLFEHVNHCFGVFNFKCNDFSIKLEKTHNECSLFDLTLSSNRAKIGWKYENKRQSNAMVISEFLKHEARIPKKNSEICYSYEYSYKNAFQKASLMLLFMIPSFGFENIQKRCILNFLQRVVRVCKWAWHDGETHKRIPSCVALWSCFL